MAATASAFVEQFSSEKYFSKTEVSAPDSPTDSYVKNPMSFDSAGAKLSIAEETVLAMGIPETFVQMAKAFLVLQHGTDFTDASQLFTVAEGLWNCPDEQTRILKTLEESKQNQKEEKSDSTDLFAKGVENKDAGNFVEASTSHSGETQKEMLVDEKPSVDSKVQLKEKVRELARENCRLRQRKMCRMCKEVDLASSGITFLPCGHFITCESCSEKCDDCPACGKSIMGTVRTFLS